MWKGLFGSVYIFWNYSQNFISSDCNVCHNCLLNTLYHLWHTHFNDCNWQSSVTKIQTSLIVWIITTVNGDAGEVYSEENIFLVKNILFQVNIRLLLCLVALFLAPHESCMKELLKSTYFSSTVIFVKIKVVVLIFSTQCSVTGSGKFCYFWEVKE